MTVPSVPDVLGAMGKDGRIFLRLKRLVERLSAHTSQRHDVKLISPSVSCSDQVLGGRLKRAWTLAKYAITSRT